MMNKKVTTQYEAASDGWKVMCCGKQIGYVWIEDGSWNAECSHNGLSWDTIGGTMDEAVKIIVDNTP